MTCRHRVPANGCRHILRYLVSAAMTLIVDILDAPGDIHDVRGRETRSDTGLVGSLAQFVETWMADQGCDLNKVLVGCKEMERLAIAAVEGVVMAGNRAHVSCRLISPDDQRRPT
jgi:hypothetical protein